MNQLRGRLLGKTVQVVMPEEGCDPRNSADVQRLEIEPAFAVFRLTGHRDDDRAWRAAKENIYHNWQCNEYSRMDQRYIDGEDTGRVWP